MGAHPHPRQVIAIFKEATAALRQTQAIRGGEEWQEEGVAILRVDVPGQEGGEGELDVGVAGRSLVLNAITMGDAEGPGHLFPLDRLSHLILGPRVHCLRLITPLPFSLLSPCFQVDKQEEGAEPRDDGSAGRSPAPWEWRRPSLAIDRGHPSFPSP